MRQVNKHAIWLIPLALSLSLSYGAYIAADQEAEKRVMRLEQEIQRLSNAYKEARATLEDLRQRNAPFETLRYFEQKAADLREELELLQKGLEGWKARLAGDESSAKPSLEGFEASLEQKKRKQQFREYVLKWAALKMAKTEEQRKTAQIALTEARGALPEPSRTQAEEVAELWVRVSHSLQAMDMVEHSRLMVLRRVLEERLNALSRAVYHIGNLKGGYLPNPRFQDEFTSLYGHLFSWKRDEKEKDPDKPLQDVVEKVRSLLASAAAKSSEARQAYLTGFFGVDGAQLRMEADELAYLTAVLARGAALLAEVKSELAEADSLLTKPLKQLGYSVEAENRRPITIDKRGYPSDVVFILDVRAGHYLPVLEGDATAGPFPPFGAIPLKPDSQQLDFRLGKPYPHSEGLRWVYTVNLFNHNNNIGLPQQFLQLRKTRPELFAQNASADIAKALVNFWHPEVREFVRKYFRAVGRFFHALEAFLLYDHFIWEPSTAVYGKRGDDPSFGYATQCGRNPEAVAAFQSWLEKKFKRIERLNQAWGSRYASFAEIQPPADPFLERRRKATPLTYEHERFLRESVAEFVGMAAAAIQETDPIHPIVYDMPGMMNYCLEASFSNHELLTRVPATVVDVHKNTF